MDWLGLGCHITIYSTWAQFPTGADGWLVARVLVRDANVVTREQSAPESRKEIRLPDVCDQFGVRRDNTFATLRALDVRFDWVGGEASEEKDGT